MRICFFGDSFTNGTGDDECLGWVGRACVAERRRGHDLTLYNLGVRRDTSEDILRRWRTEAEARLPTACDPRFVFAFGNNDSAPSENIVSPRLSESASCENAEATLIAAKKWAPTLMVGPIPSDTQPAWRDRIVSLSDQFALLCARIEVPFLDLAKLPSEFWLTWHAQAAAGDGAHPNAAAYAHLANYIGQWPAWRAWFDR